MKPSEVLKQSRRSVKRLRQMDDEIAMMASRVGGQGTGFGTSIDHSVILDPMRNLDDYIDATWDITSTGREIAFERRQCVADRSAAETLLAGAEQAIVKHSMDEGVDAQTAFKNATDMCFVMRGYYVSAWTMTQLCEKTGYSRRANERMLKYCLEWMDHIGIAKLKAGIKYE